MTLRELGHKIDDWLEKLDGWLKKQGNAILDFDLEQILPQLVCLAILGAVIWLKIRFKSIPDRDADE